MKLNIAYPATGCQKVFDFEDEKKVRIFYDKRVSQEVDGSSLGDEWKGYVFRIGGGNDKQGFPMKQGILTNQRVRLLLGKGHSCYRPRRTGERKRKSVRGCIVDGNLSVLSLVIVKKGEQDIPGLTDTTVPRRLGPKRASKIRKLFNLSKEDDVRQYVLRRPVTSKSGKTRTKAPKIQRLVTPMVLQRKRRRVAMKRRRATKHREEAAEYAKLLAQRAKDKQAEKIARRRSSASRSSQSEEKKVVKASPTPPPQAAAAKSAAATKPKPAPAAAPAKAPSKATSAKKPAEAKAKPAAKAPAKQPPKKEGGKK